MFVLGVVVGAMSLWATNGVFSYVDESIDHFVFQTSSKERVASPIVTAKIETKTFSQIGRAVFIPPSIGKAIRVDLDTKKLYLYEDGEMIGGFDVKSIGKVGSPWETPAGVYQIKTKEEDHVSSIGNVHMPWSMQFFGNYFIHGWPSYLDGTPVPEGYSGGCIRLSESDAHEVYLFAEIGTVVGIDNIENARSGDEIVNHGYHLKRGGDPEPPPVAVLSYLVADIETGHILLEKDKNMVLPIASVSKLVTALVDLEVVNQFQTTTISEFAYNTHGGTGNLGIGEKINTGSLIYPLLLESSNDASEVIAEHIGRLNFISKMNAKARSIGLINTSFEDPSGISSNNVSTAEDLFKLARYVYDNKQYVYDLTRLRSKLIVGEDGALDHEWWNNNQFVIEQYDKYRGGKGGYTTAAGGTLVAVFSVPLAEFEDRNIAIVILNSDIKYDEVKTLINYLEENIYYGQ